MPRIERTPETFDDTASVAEDMAKLLVEPALDNDENRLFLAVRIFQAARFKDAGMLAVADLRAILEAMSDERTRSRLVERGMIEGGDKLMAIKASPSEMHPNTLPTVQVCFGEKVLFFKGRSEMTEAGLVGDASGAVVALADGHGSVGTHKFAGFPGGGDIGGGDNAHLAASVGKSVEGKVAPEQMADAWSSAVKTAVSILVSATSDMHASNFVDGSSGKRHIIDGEFLLNAKVLGTLRNYRPLDANLPFKLAPAVPTHLRQATSQMKSAARKKLAQKVVDDCSRLWVDDGNIIDPFVAKLRDVIEQDVPLRAFVGLTDEWLGLLPLIHQIGANPTELTDLLRAAYSSYQKTNAEYFEFGPDDEAVPELVETLTMGGVPVFHVRSKSGVLFLNKKIKIGWVREPYAAVNILAGALAFARGNREAIEAAVRKEIVGK